MAAVATKAEDVGSDVFATVEHHDPRSWPHPCLTLRG